jgi:hypothetical protein
MNSKYIYTYSDKGHKTEDATYNASGMIESSSKYDDKGNKISKVSYNTFGIVSEKDIYKYDDTGNKIEEIQYNKLNKPFLKIEYIYSK